ncbi:hypothetical protein J4Z08_21215 [Citrobacter portucalensis]|uniref:hypothetical protein n=1 Tax=Citrobacter portucalensis TaxID=1639133 RepID=UPI0031402B3A
MKLNRITASLITVLGSNMLVMPAIADRIIQKPSGAFYIVSDQEASSIFDRNNFGFFSLPPSVNYPTYTRPAKAKAKKVHVKKAAAKKQVQCAPVSCPATPVKPVTTVESADSIFLRLEKKNK